MNKAGFMRILIISMSFLLLTGLARAEIKIAFVNQQVLLEKAPQAEAARKRIQKEFAKRDRAMVALQKKIINKEKKFQKDSAIMSNTQVSRLKRKIVSMKRDLERDKEAFREDLSIRQNEELVKLQKVVLKAINRVATKYHYDLILSDGVVYASKKIDVTQKVLVELKKLYQSK